MARNWAALLEATARAAAMSGRGLPRRAPRALAAAKAAFVPLCPEVQSEAEVPLPTSVHHSDRAARVSFVSTLAVARQVRATADEGGLPW